MVAELTFWPIIAVILACMVAVSPLYGAVTITACAVVLVKTRKRGK
jgi:hypothetical protein